jgi:hypothetical protein
VNTTHSFVGEAESASVEHIRKMFNPLQYALIKVDVTLCGEVELEGIEKFVFILNGKWFSD